MEEIKKTGYEWCLEANVRLSNLSQWDTEWPLYEDSYFKELIDSKTFYVRLERCDVKPNSQPRKKPLFLEYRMYGLVNYQLSGTIHAGIQYGHSVIEYSQNIRDMGNNEDVYNKWAREDKTFIILNGGTTNDSKEHYGTLQKNRDLLIDNEILFSEFREPDLNNALTSICFLVDERVFNRNLYKDFEPEILPYYKKKRSEKELLTLDERNKNNYLAWEEKIGGTKNAFLRTFLKNFKLA
jgi:hypothetical protein